MFGTDHLADISRIGDRHDKHFFPGILIIIMLSIFLGKLTENCTGFV
jgi:hypothetical protein